LELKVALRTGVGDTKHQRVVCVVYGVRLHDQQYGRFLSTNAMWEKYRVLQAYQYVGDQPMNKFDADGDSAVVLVQYDGAMGMGYAAILIGNEVNGWNYYCNNGGSLWVAGTSENPIKGDHYESLQSFKKSDEGTRYDEAFLLEASASTDK